MSFTLLDLKIIFIFSIWTLAFVSGIVPAKSKKCKESPKFLSICVAFSGGIFLAIALMDILPEAVDNYY